ncbi:MAG TPA: hypothetical protein VMF30_17345 [Pirellulales bacterium]|nr:hypothetical protein [Pirellulales bacterium]
MEQILSSPRAPKKGDEPNVAIRPESEFFGEVTAILAASGVARFAGTGRAVQANFPEAGHLLKTYWAFSLARFSLSYRHEPAAWFNNQPPQCRKKVEKQPTEWASAKSRVCSANPTSRD